MKRHDYWSWEAAFARAFENAQVEGRQHFVRAFRDSDGTWCYGALHDQAHVEIWKEKDETTERGRQDIRS